MPLNERRRRTRAGRFMTATLAYLPGAAERASRNICFLDRIPAVRRTWARWLSPSRDHDLRLDRGCNLAAAVHNGLEAARLPRPRRITDQRSRTPERLEMA